MGALARIMFSMARSQPAGVLVRNCFAYGSFLLPLKRIQESSEYVAFYHPKPIYDHHMVLVPKKPLPDVFVLGTNPRYAAALFRAAQNIVADLHWKPGSYVLCANGGPRQDVPQVHFHLYAGSLPLFSMEGRETQLALQRENVNVVCRVQSEQFYLQVALVAGPRNEAPSDAFLFSSLLQALPTLNDSYHLVQQGYTFALNDVAPQGASDLTGYVLTRSKKEA
jgi:histidine triad (HIT) family protein